MSGKQYNNVEISQEEISGLFEEQTTESAPETPQEVSEPESEVSATEGQPQEETSQEATESPEVASEGVVIDGVSYDMNAIQEWMEDSRNKSEWQKNNTEKSQQLSQWNKFHEKINSDEEFRNHIKSFFYDDESQIQKLGLDKDFEIVEEPESNEEAVPSEVEERLNMLESIESERIMENRVDLLDQQMTTLETNFPDYLGEEKSGEFLAYAEKHADRFIENGLPNLDKVFKEWSYDAMQTELTHLKKLNNNKVRNDDAVIGSPKVGVKEIAKPKSYASYKDISLSDKDISKYFDE
jgi:hypothetical protein